MKLNAYVKTIRGFGVLGFWGFGVPMFSASSGKMEGGFGEAYFGVSIPQTLGNVSVPQGSSLDTKPSLVFGLEFGLETQ